MGFERNRSPLSGADDRPAGSGGDHPVLFGRSRSVRIRADKPDRRLGRQAHACNCGCDGVINALFGTLLAFVLVRYKFPGRGLLSTLADLPLAIPTLVTGVMLAALYGPVSPL
ncbi:MAG: hypothetical protein H0W21_02310, partial [Actinobacteria bacterium]|nr:hypothetical protein [Actinomycetota bacterium]